MMILLMSLGCSRWEEEEVEGLRHLSAELHAGASAESVRVPLLDGETSALLVVDADPLRSTLSRWSSPRSQVWEGATSASRTDTNGAYVAATTAFNWPVLDDDAALTGGDWTATIGVVDDDLSYASGAFLLDVWTKSDPDPDNGDVAISLVFTDGLGDDPALAAAVDAAVARWRELVAPSGLTLTVTSSRWDGDAPGLPGQATPDVWRELSEGPVRRVNLVFVETIAELPNAYGLAGGIPGPLGSTENSGVILSVGLAAGADGLFSDDEIRLLGETMAHETGHYLGLFHPVEIGWEHWDAVDDTPECSSEADCHSALSRNLMFPYPVCTITRCVAQDELTGHQGRITQRHVAVD